MNTIGCPLCYAKGQQVVLQVGMSKASCPGCGTAWDDMAELRSLNPPMIPLKGNPLPPKQPPAGAISYQLAIPSALRDAMIQKYGDEARAQATLVSVMESMVMPGTFIWGPFDTKRVLDMFPDQKITSSQGVLGLIFQLKTERDTAQASEQKAAQSRSGGSVEALFDQPTREKLAGKVAKFKKPDTATLVRDVVVHALNMGMLD